VGPSGIWKPAACELPISITTTVGGPYDDSFDRRAGTLRYAYRGLDPGHRDNRGLRRAMVERVPIVYFHAIEPGSYVAAYPVFVVDDHPGQLRFSMQVDDLYAAAHELAGYGAVGEDAAEAGADLAGFVLAPESPRAAARVLSVPATMLSVAVWVGEASESSADLDQVHERADGKVRGRDGVLLRGGEPVARVLDLPWEGEDPGHWERAAGAEGRIMLAGRLGPDNVAAAIAAVRPWAVDASSQLESAPGIKDRDRVNDYVEAARR